MRQLIAAYALFLCLPIHPANAQTLFTLKTHIQSHKSDCGHSRLFVKLIIHAPAQLNKEAPLSLEILQSEGVRHAKTCLVLKDVKSSADNELDWELSLKSTGSGSQKVFGSASFYLCTDKSCRKFEKEFVESLKTTCGAA